MVHPTEKYYEQDFIWNEVQSKYHESANQINWKIAIERGYTFVDVDDFKEKDEAFLKFADELEKERRQYLYKVDGIEYE